MAVVTYPSFSIEFSFHVTYPNFGAYNIECKVSSLWLSQVARGKESVTNAGAAENKGLIPGWEDPLKE